jgi:hypothetical protein
MARWDGSRVNLSPEVANLVQWVISQGIGVAVAVLVLYLVGLKVDKMNSTLVGLQLTIQALIDHLRGSTGG